ncbi:cytochrome c3 family protein [Paraglaciecola polaris]|nr:cytochrome c3 family protein [Paraglaciecola polaris]
MKKFFWLAMALIAIVALISHFVHSPDSIPDVNWESAVSPGDLSAAHAFMETDCLGCHTPATGVTRDNCVVCHANDTHILQRQPTAFHADVAECASCHKEHKGKLASISQMDHEALVNVGLNMLPDPNVPFDEGTATLAFLESLLANSRKPDPIFVHPDVMPKEALLSCPACHSNDDRHFGLFGKDCVQCHSTRQWTLPEFIHPSNQSLDCNQCHEAPPSHYMQHFKMISAQVAGELNAKVEECYACHQSTSWNDIKRAGWYKHH